MIGTLARGTAAALAVGALAVVGAGPALADTSVSTATQASAVQPYRGDICDNERNQWAPQCRHHDTWRWDRQHNRWDHWRFNDRDRRWHQR